MDPVALHIHERVSAQAILKVAAREDVNCSLFADPEQEYNEAVQFYKHDVGWSNRLILGDSLQVMSSLARREDLAGKVQMIYLDPPYGIRFGSNFQPIIGKREPVGYLNIRSDSGACIIGRDPERFPVVKRLFELLLAGAIFQRGPPRSRKRPVRVPVKTQLAQRREPMSRSALYRMSRNPFYPATSYWMATGIAATTKR